MRATLESLTAFLGQPVWTLLSTPPFKDWSFDRSVDKDLVRPIIDYTFPNHGLDVICDGEDRIATLFLFNEAPRFFAEEIADFPLSSTRQKVAGRLGPPSLTGEAMSHPLLGESGPWERFSRPGFVIHIAYRAREDLVGLVTLMRNDMVPPEARLQ